ncbi:receptor protein kinase-like protein At4g34220 [Vicia villosa]|uniref:receptor protein kinase-like protein At4g34220 n=1 Tax=Vicia villosa TaxID=3911 RepID=UPI00273B0C0B|nr:receptor protein kinase-like protein At4g34220 [Vicia villosa]
MMKLKLNTLLRVSSFFVLLLLQYSVALNSDGIFLLKFRYSILSDPLSVFENWNYDDATPCSWHGVACSELGSPNTPDFFRVTSLILPNSQLLGSIAEELGFIQNLHHIDLSNNFLNGSLPNSIFNSSQLQFLSLSNNVISGKLPELVGLSTNLQILNLSENAFAGSIPENLTSLHNLTIVSLKSNYFSGEIPNGFNSVVILDLSSNLLNGSLPSNFQGQNLQYLNLSYNKLSGAIPQTFTRHIPEKSTIDLSFNNLTGPIPESLFNQKTESLSGNSDLCGKPLKTLCTIPSTKSTAPHITNSSSPAIAAIPITIDSGNNTNTTTTTTTSGGSQNGLKPATIAAIVVGDIAGMGVLALIILFVYQQRKKRYPKSTNVLQEKNASETVAKQEQQAVKAHLLQCSSCCLTVKQQEETSEATASDDSDREIQNLPKEGTLVMLDGETKMDLETLLKASAYILGTSRASIVYKAVLQDGRVFAVRRIGECGVERMKEFENQIRVIAKIRHPNLVRIRGFCWGEDEKLVISDFVPNGSLSAIGYRRGGLSPMNLSLELRLKIGKGMARGLAYIHEKKYVHGNVKPSNILLNSEMEPIISDFGLDLLLLNDINHRGNDSARQLVNQKTQQQQEFLIGSTPSPYTTMGSSSSTSGGCGGGQVQQYQAPESFQNIKPNAKMDVYSFGVVLLELFSGRVFSDRELDQWSVLSGSVEEEKNRVLRLVDVAIKHEIEGRENVVFTCFKLGFNCVSLVPQKRPSMKEVLQTLEKISTVGFN